MSRDLLTCEPPLCQPLPCVGLFGGTFDPFHIGHEHIALSFAQELQLQKVYIIPAGDPYHKRAPTAPARQRYNLVKAWHRALDSYLQAVFEVLDIEVVRDKPSYTIDTVKQVKSRLPACELWLLLGADAYQNLHTWHESAALQQQVNIAVAARSGAVVNLHNGPQQERVYCLKSHVLDVSSSAIRQALQQGEWEEVQKWLPQAVWHAMRQDACYGLKP